MQKILRPNREFTYTPFMAEWLQKEHMLNGHVLNRTNKGIKRIFHRPSSSQGSR
jgi:hypothetical protein